MMRQCFLVRYGSDVPAAMYRRSADDCAKLLGLDICYDVKCPDRREWMAHAHIPDNRFGPPQSYSPEDVSRAGFRYREGRLPDIGTIRWELYSGNDPQRVIFFESVKFIV